MGLNAWNIKQKQNDKSLATNTSNFYMFVSVLIYLLRMKKLPVFSFYFMELNFSIFFSFWSHSDLLTVPSKEKNQIFKNLFFILLIYH